MKHFFRRIIVFVYCLLAVFLLLVQWGPSGGELTLHALLFTVYAGCGIAFWRAYPRFTAGAFVTITGFFVWAFVFPVASLFWHLMPQAHIESEIWNLPKFVVAAGMILLLLEDQIEHSKHLALHDELTGLANRRLFQDRLSTALERSRRAGSQAALLLIDLDRFKYINDTLGHHVGDLLLQFVAQAFTGRVRRTDTVARTGGDEFCIILEEPTSRDDAEQVGRSLQQMLNEPIELDGHTVQAGASIGVAIFPDDASQEEALMIFADQRMYENKHAGRAARETASGGMPQTDPVHSPAIHLHLADASKSPICS